MRDASWCHRARIIHSAAKQYSCRTCNSLISQMPRFEACGGCNISDTAWLRREASPDPAYGRAEGVLDIYKFYQKYA